MTDDHAAELKRAADEYRAAKAAADNLMRPARETLAAQVRAAYRGGMRKYQILETIDHLWSREWVDRTIGKPAAKKAVKRAPRRTPR